MGMRRLWVFCSIALSAAALAAPRFPHADTPPSNAASTSALYPIFESEPIYPSGARSKGSQGCTRVQFAVGADGKPRDIEIWSHYPSDVFDQATINAIAKWRFHPRIHNGRPIATEDVVQTFIFRLPGAPMEISMGGVPDDPETRVSSIASHIRVNSGRTEAVRADTLAWLCRQAPMHGVAIFAQDSQPPPSATNERASKWNGINPAVYLTPSFPRGSAPGRVRIRFCVGPDGNVRNTVVRDSSPKGIYEEAARQALEGVEFFARERNKQPVWTCGLTVPVSFSGALSGRLGQIGPLSYRRLSGQPSEPTLKVRSSVKVMPSIPAGTKLPPVAKVELSLCIEKDGGVSEATVVHADPPRYFDRAAIETVENWRFERLPARICDVYESVRFPLGNR